MRRFWTYVLDRFILQCTPKQIQARDAKRGRL